MVVDINNKKTAIDPLAAQKVMVGPASPSKRLLAFIIDILIINTFVLFPFDGLLNRLVPSTSALSINSPVINSDLMTTIYAIAIMFFTYFIVFEYKMGQTPGKMIFGLFVISSDVQKNQLQKLTFWQIITRNLSMFLVFPFVLLLIIDPIFILFNKNNQRLLEQLSKSIVIERYQV